MTPEIEEASAAAVDRALELLALPRPGTRIYKTDRDYATDADYEIEDQIRRLLRHRTPAMGLQGEERGHDGPAELYWCLDPIDGTTNFSRKIPNFGVALAAISKGLFEHGEIALPALGERYVTRSGGAFGNGRALHVARTAHLVEAIVSFGDFATGEGSTDKNRVRLQTLCHLANTVGRVRMLGSAATDLAWLAAGRVDVVVLHSNKTWDVAAGIALARAAGAVVTHHDGAPYTIGGPDVLAAAPLIHEQMIDILRQCF